MTRSPRQEQAGALRMYLGLNEDQLGQMMQARAQAAAQVAGKMDTLRQQIGEKRLALQKLMDGGTNDAAAVGKAMLELRSLEQEQKKAADSIRESGLSALTPEQRTKFQAVIDAALLPMAAREAVRLGLVPGMPAPEPAAGMAMPLRARAMSGRGMAGQRPLAPAAGPMAPGRGQGRGPMQPPPQPPPQQ